MDTVKIKKHREKWDNRIEYLLENNSYLSPWEEEFIDSIEIKRHKGNDLTPKQVGKLYEIFHRVENDIG